jgi:hypothetical protein
VDRGVALEFLSKGANVDRVPVLYELETRSAADVRAYGNVVEEKEVVLRKGTKYNVTDVVTQTRRGARVYVFRVKEAN